MPNEIFLVRETCECWLCDNEWYLVHALEELTQCPICGVVTPTQWGLLIDEWLIRLEAL